MGLTHKSRSRRKVLVGTMWMNQGGGGGETMNIPSLLKRMWTRLAKMFGKPEPPPVITTDYGPVTEWARFAAAQHIKSDPETKQRVEALLVQKMGSEEAGMAEARRRYREAYED